MAEVTIRYFAAARAAAGAAEQRIEVEAPTPLGELIGRLGRERPGLADVLGHCSFLVNAEAAPDLGRLVEPGDSVDALPPFAGG